MPVNKPKRNGTYVPLSAHYYKDDAIAAAGERAELLYVRSLAFSAETLSDGFVSYLQVTRFVGVGMRDVKRRVAALIEHGLWEEADGGYRIVSWLKWNRSKAEIDELAAKDRGRKQSKPDEAADEPSNDQADSERNPDADQPDSDPDSERNPTSRARARPHTSTSTNTSTNTKGEARARGRRRDPTPAPENLLITSDMRAWAKKNQIPADLDGETEYFLDHHRAKGSTYVDWHAAWRTWMKNTHKWGPNVTPFNKPLPNTRIAEQ